MQKKIAVIVRERQAEALRMAVGLTLEDDEISVYIMDSRLDLNDPVITMNVDMLNDLGVRVASNIPENNVGIISTEDIAGILPQYDSVIPY